MSDKYLDLVSAGPLKRVAGTLGLPRPVRLKRYSQGHDLPASPVLVLGESAVADGTAETLLDWGLEVRRHAVPGERLGGIVAVFDQVEKPADLGDVMLAVGGALRALEPSGRVITVFRDADASASPAQAAARRGVDGATRSLAHEMRAGATANGIVLAEGVAPVAPSVLGALRFLLSGRSAYVSGQFLHIGSEAGGLPADPSRPLEGRTAVVTGAARGIGAEIARVLHRDGARIIGVDVVPASESLAAVMNEVQGTAVQLDITAEDAAAKIAKAARGPVDILVNNAGITRDKLLANMKPEQWHQVLDVNVQAQLQLNAGLLEAGAFGPEPRIIGLTSTSGIAGNRGQTNYAASKAGVIGLTRASAPELAGAGGTINAVAPGFIETEMTAKMPPVTREVARRLSSLQQGGLPVDVAEAIAFLAAPQAGGINGTVLRVCGQNMVGA
ncbi:3-oxoacyl-ACP reductase [Sediminivirga luteola]|uniref:3-oxoacyl-ACP reductase n=1 Tax=Sediminivirga luteola TaxID=1774748 RepID=UPI001F57F969|nr:3-oxoacyl-ACP reductase [Sediminivirga luteola]MCI2266247.1 3-oxoacyl-ACP reductase [Sediminivirga luteola]